jgi:dTDP-4-amino-4,6-dideoxygalactose transaminase
VITNSDDIADKIRIIRDHGRDPKDGKVKLFGYNSRLDNVQAAVLGAKLKYYDVDIARRRSIASIYQERLGDIDTLLLPPSPDGDPKHFDIYQNYEIEAESRDQLRKFLDSRGVGTILPWGGYTIHQFDALGLNDDLPFTDAMTERFMLLPMHQMLSDEDVNYVCDQVIAFYN